MKRSFIASLVLLAGAGQGALAQAPATGGAFPDRADVVSIPFEGDFHLPKSYVLPPATDLSAWFPPAGDQGGQASCSGWALGYALATYFRNRQMGEPEDLPGSIDPDAVFSPSFLYNLLLAREQLSTCTVGVQLPDAVRLVCDIGCSTWRQFPADTVRLKCHRPVPDQAMADARNHRMRFPISIDNRNYEQWKYHLAQGEPVIFFVSVGALFHKGFDTQGRSPYVWNETVPTNWDGREGHIMVCTGYRGDTLVALNSWGTGWGLRGYVDIPASTMQWACSDAYVLRAGEPPVEVVRAAEIKQRSLRRDRRLKGGLHEEEVHAADGLLWQRTSTTDIGDLQVISIHDAASGSCLHALALCKDQPATFHHAGALYTFTRTGQGLFSGQMRYRLVKDEKGCKAHVDRKLERIDLHSDGIIDGGY